MKTCPICHNVSPNLDSHHIIPQAKSKGILREEVGLGPVIDICPTCHQNVHSIAKAAIAGNDCSKFIAHNLPKEGLSILNKLVKALILSSANMEADEQKKKVTIIFTFDELQSLDTAIEKLFGGKVNRTEAIRELISRGIKSSFSSGVHL